MIEMYSPVHLGRVLKEGCEGEISVEELAEKTGIDVTHLQAIMNEEEPVTIQVAVLLTRAIPHISAKTWIKMQNNYDQWQLKHNAESLRVGHY